MAALTLARPPKSKSLKQTSTVHTLPPLIGGWNARDPLSNMDEKDAIVLDNLIPGTGSVALRRGFSSWVTGLGSFVESLMEYSPPTGTAKLFAAVPTAIYDVTATGAVGAAAVTSLSNGRFQHTMFATAGGNYLVCANGANAVRNYDGTTWTSPTINNVTSSTLISVTSHVQRLWFAKKDSLNPWYLPVASISGNATELIAAPFCKLGGYLMAMGSWSRDGGSGPDDMLVLVTSEGEVVVYTGTNPDNSDTFGLVGIYKIAQPLGRHCIVKAGADLGILTIVGLIPLSVVLGLAVSAQTTVAITDKISGAFISASAGAGINRFGWQVIEYPSARLMVINVPISERSIQYQYVMNTVTGAWCRFTAINAGCWSLLGDKLYLGGNDGTVYAYGIDYFDGTSATAIEAIAQTAFNNYDTPQSKRFTMARPLFNGPPLYVPAVECKLDYDVTPSSLPGHPGLTSSSLWDVAAWDVAGWGPTSVPNSTWQTLNGIGQVASMAMKFSLSQEFILNSIDVMYEPGGYF